MEKPERILICDAQGRSLGDEDKEACHSGKGILHAAFLVMVFNERKELVLARRSGRKTLWPEHWDGTLASHYRPGQDRPGRARDRILEELGVRGRKVDPLFTFRYRASFGDAGSENEVCDVFAARGIKTEDVRPNEREISRVRFLGMKDLAAEAASAPGAWTPWFLAAFQEYVKLFPAT